MIDDDDNTTNTRVKSFTEISNLMKNVMMPYLLTVSNLYF